MNQNWQALTWQFSTRHVFLPPTGHLVTSEDMPEAASIGWVKVTGAARQPMVHGSPQERMIWPSRSGRVWSCVVLGAGGMYVASK